jgi:hypothetical protein
MKRAVFVMLTLLALVLISGCTSQQQDPAAVVLKNLEARTTGNADELRALTCAEREGEVDRMARSFGGREATLKDAVCTFDGTSTVSCTGSIVVNYEGEDPNELPLGNYSVVQEDGQWKWCGETN